MFSKRWRFITSQATRFSYKIHTICPNKLATWYSFVFRKFFLADAVVDVFEETQQFWRLIIVLIFVLYLRAPEKPDGRILSFYEDPKTIDQFMQNLISFHSGQNMFSFHMRLSNPNIVCDKRLIFLWFFGRKTDVMISSIICGIAVCLPEIFVHGWSKPFENINADLGFRSHPQKCIVIVASNMCLGDFCPHHHQRFHRVLYGNFFFFFGKCKSDSVGAF